MTLKLISRVDVHLILVNYWSIYQKWIGYWYANWIDLVTRVGIGEVVIGYFAICTHSVDPWTLIGEMWPRGALLHPTIPTHRFWYSCQFICLANDMHFSKISVSATLLGPITGFPPWKLEPFGCRTQWPLQLSANGFRQLYWAELRVFPLGNSSCSVAEPNSPCN